MPLLEGKNAQGLFRGKRALPSPTAAGSKIAVPEVAHGVDPFKDDGEQRSVRLPSGGGAQHVLAFPAALDRRDQFAHRRVPATLLQAFEFAAERAELFVGLFFVVQHWGMVVGWMEGSGWCSRQDLHLHSRRSRRRASAVGLREQKKITP